MNLSKRGEYALRVMLDLTIAQRRGARLVPLAALAEAQNIPVGFLEQILLRLRQGGFLASTRGKNGGYSLARSEADIRIGDIIRFLDGSLAPIACVSQSGYQRCSCPDEARCGIRQLMISARDALSKVLDGATLEALAESTLHAFEVDGLLPDILRKLVPQKKVSSRRATRDEPEYLI